MENSGHIELLSLPRVMGECLVHGFTPIAHSYLCSNLSAMTKASTPYWTGSSMMPSVQQAWCKHVKINLRLLVTLGGLTSCPPFLPPSLRLVFHSWEPLFSAFRDINKRVVTMNELIDAKERVLQIPSRGRNRACLCHHS